MGKETGKEEDDEDVEGEEPRRVGVWEGTGFNGQVWASFQ